MSSNYPFYYTVSLCFILHIFVHYHALSVTHCCTSLRITMRFCTFPRITVHFRALPCITVHFRALPRITVHYRALPLEFRTGIPGSWKFPLSIFTNIAVSRMIYSQLLIIFHLFQKLYNFQYMVLLSF